MRAGRAAVQDRGLGRLDADDLHAGLALLEHLAHTRDGAARADAGHDDVDGAVGVRPDLLGGGLAVDGRVGLVGELAGQDRARTLGGDLLGAVHGALHALRARGEDQFGAVGAQEGPALLGHGLRHGQDHVVAAGGAHHGQGDAGVAGGGFDDRAARGQGAGGLGGVDDRDPDAVLDRVGGVVELEFGQHGGRAALVEAVDPHERGVADQGGDVVVDAGHGSSFG